MAQRFDYAVERVVLSTDPDISITFSLCLGTFRLALSSNDFLVAVLVYYPGDGTEPSMESMLDLVDIVNGSRPCAGPFTQEANRLQPDG